MEALLAALRRRGLVPRALWVSGLRDGVVAQGVGRLLAREQVEAVICGTAFASVQFDEAGLGAPLWDELGVPVLQLLASSQSRASWQASSIGLSPLDLSLQVALPELDGRLTTRRDWVITDAVTGEHLGAATRCAAEHACCPVCVTPAAHIQLH